MFNTPIVIICDNYMHFLNLHKMITGGMQQYVTLHFCKDVDHSKPLLFKGVKTVISYYTKPELENKLFERVMFSRQFNQVKFKVVNYLP